MELIGRRYHDLLPVRLTLEQGKVRACEPLEGDSLAPLPLIAPGLVDLQVNGFGGVHFNEPGVTAEGLREAAAGLATGGVTAFCPTLTTQSSERLEKSFADLAAACEATGEAEGLVIGFHLEGPYISAEDGPRGAHPMEHCREPSWAEFSRWQEAAGGRIKIITLAPELPGAAEFIAQVSKTGVLVALGHTAADSAAVARAVEAGARMSTHLGNGAHGTIRRHPNYIWDQLADDRLSASLIADGHHLPLPVLQSFLRAKTPDRCLLVSDITGLAGLPPGLYEGTALGDVEILEDGRMVVAHQRQYLAGAALPLAHGVATLARQGEVSLATALELASKHAAEMLGIAAGGFEPHAPADFLVLDEPPAVGPPRLPVRATIKAGRTIPGSPA